MPYTPHTEKEVRDMLDVIGLETESDLFSSVPKELQVHGIDLPEGLDEFSTFEKFKSIAAKNVTNKTIFMGGGYYDHIVPSAVDALAGRSEFYTSYTPYQAEASQGTLQVLYEYQSMICELSGMDVSNASMYDGASALAESALMAIRISRKRNKILIDGGINPTYIKVVQTYLSFRDIEFEVINVKDYKTDRQAVLDKIDDTVAGYLFQNPNFFGTIDDFKAIVEKLHEHKALAVVSAYPISLGMLKDPASMGADIFCADGQCLGNYMNFGGPSFGMIATKEKYIRDLPGRIIGRTLDKDGNELFVLTMQAREQHIRRHRATSNICSNQNLVAVRSTIFMSLLGEDGLAEMANLCFSKATYLKEVLAKIDGVMVLNSEDSFNEFVISTPLDSGDLLAQLRDKGFYAGINLANIDDNFKNEILVSVTEKRTKEQMDALVSSIGDVL
ncbi:aminomethyl-transferring glycine dehydrogenase subunit GcvPA [Sulfurovum sp.]|uniref:aminomethyl-transferring glycine dehydrogenase subunit GcvPA n=1 Tax=Sulfurovum sp. TaxID=1969726 RepID=UPI00286818E5|nr:aminomethyl-transferring glycine dehydrogenase subunit GcvPA [Sulfurovum sp.]